MSSLHFLRPWWFLALLPLPWLLWRWWHRHAGATVWNQVCDPHLLPYLLEQSTSSTSRRRVFLLALVALLLIGALAGPVWQKVPQPLLHNRSALVIVLDLSRSMEAADWQPSRLVRAKQKIVDLLRQRQDGITALVVFAGEGFVVTPLTEDSATIMLQLSALQPQLMPVQGSRPERGLRKALQLLQQSGIRHGQMLLLTDGWEGEESVVAEVAESGHRLAILGVGTPQGAPIPLPEGGFLKESNGEIVIAKLAEEQLRRLAQAGGGDYQPLRNEDSDWQSLLQQREDVQSLTRTAHNAEQWREEGPWLVVAALPLLALAYRRGVLWLWLWLCLWPHSSQAMEWSDWWQRPDQQGMALWQQNNPAAAAERFSDSLWRAAALYQAGEKEKALQLWQQEGSPQALYNAGTLLAEQGRLPEAAQLLQQVLQRQPDHADAQQNLQWVQKALRGQEEQKKGAGQEDKQQKNQESDAAKGQKDAAAEKSAQQQEREKSQQHSASSALPEQGQSREKPPGEPDKGQKEASRAEEAKEKQPPVQLLESKEGEQALSLREAATPPTENEKAAQFWLRRVPDDPGGLLRRKFLYQSQRDTPGALQEKIKPW